MQHYQSGTASSQQELTQSIYSLHTATCSTVHINNKKEHRIQRVQSTYNIIEEAVGETGVKNATPRATFQSAARARARNPD